MDGTILNEWDFPVHEEMMQTTTGIKIPANMQKAIIRSDTNQPLATVGKKYTIVKHQDVVKSIRDAISKANISKDFTENIEVFDGGKRIRGSMLFNDMTIEPMVGDYIKYQVLYYNSYDGTWSFSVAGMGFRLFCNNGCADQHSIAKTVNKHTANINIQASTKQIEKSADIFFNNIGWYKAMSLATITDLQAEGFFKLHMCRAYTKTSEEKINKKRLEKLMGFWIDNKRQVGSNKWALYNACTYWATHTNDVKNPEIERNERERLVAKAVKETVWSI
tara:strand:- start:6197 stop:7027 length:831 start_codon:yes stop_codon:yes gene_type:complete